jgi:hypothetical protein
MRFLTADLLLDDSLHRHDAIRLLHVGEGCVKAS